MVTTATQALEVTPSDDTDLDDAAQLFWIGGAGNVSLETLDGGTVVYVGHPGGAYLYQAATRVNATGTTATAILACYARDVT